MKKKTSAEIRKTLISAVIKTFSDMAFIDAEVLNEVPESLDYSHVIHITISEPEHGEMAMFLPSECKRMIVENIYSNNWTTLHATEIDDCLLEMLNVLAGNFLTGYFGNEVKHDISLPELLFDSIEIDKRNGFTEVFFNAEACPFKVSVNFIKK